MEKVKFAVIGCGNIAIRNSIPAFRKSKYADVVVCIDINKKIGELIKKQFGLPFEDTLNKALINFDFDAIYISTPINTHKHYCFEAAKNKKHILCEKSLALTLNEVEKILRVCEENDVSLFEGFMYQFHGQHEFVRNLIAHGEIGRAVHYQAWFGFPPLPKDNFRYSKTLGGGALLDAGAYTIHSARKFFNREPKRIFFTSDYEQHEVDIRGTASMDFGDGQTAHLVYGFNNMYQNNYIIWGERGVIKLERAFSLPEDFSSTLTLIQQGNERKIPMVPHNHFLEEFDYFSKNFRNKSLVKSWMIDALNQAKVLHNKL